MLRSAPADPLLPISSGDLSYTGARDCSFFFYAADSSSSLLPGNRPCLSAIDKHDKGITRTHHKNIIKSHSFYMNRVTLDIAQFPIAPASGRLAPHSFVGDPPFSPELYGILAPRPPFILEFALTGSTGRRYSARPYSDRVLRNHIYPNKTRSRDLSNYYITLNTWVTQHGEYPRKEKAIVLNFLTQ